MSGYQLGHYILKERLGSGTFGEVFRAVHEHIDSIEVALKIMHGDISGDRVFLDALRAECTVLHQLQHPGIVVFRDLIVDQGRAIIAMELLHGCELSALIANGPLTIPAATRLFERILEPLAYAHGKGIVHCDIKPSNIFYCNDGRVKLMDFGLATAARGTQATQKSLVAGTLDYMSPERFSGQQTATSDIYAAGLVVWELLVGRPACPAGDLARKMGWHMRIGAPDLRTERPDCPSQLAEFIHTLTAPEKKHRPVDGACALAGLRAVLAALSPRSVICDNPGTFGHPATISAPPPLLQMQSVRPQASVPPVAPVVAPPIAQARNPQLNAQPSLAPQQQPSDEAPRSAARPRFYYLMPVALFFLATVLLLALFGMSLSDAFDSVRALLAREPDTTLTDDDFLHADVTDPDGVGFLPPDLARMGEVSDRQYEESMQNRLVEQKAQAFADEEKRKEAIRRVEVSKEDGAGDAGPKEGYVTLNVPDAPRGTKVYADGAYVGSLPNVSGRFEDGVHALLLITPAGLRYSTSCVVRFEEGETRTTVELSIW